MKGKIDKNGVLHIERSGTMIPTLCVNAGMLNVRCSHNCSHFGNPMKEFSRADERYCGSMKGAKLRAAIIETESRTTSRVYITSFRSHKLLGWWQSNGFSLQLCQTKLMFDEFADERGSTDKKGESK